MFSLVVFGSLIKDCLKKANLIIANTIFQNKSR